MRFAIRFAVAATMLAAFFTPASLAGAALGAPLWSQPVAGRVVRAFSAPDTPFGPGHLGVDFAAAPSTPVRSAGEGTVVFAGHVGAALHVVVLHAGDIRTTASFLATTAVRIGEHVSRGQVVGTSGGTGPGHNAGVLHFGVRVGAAYVDPMLLFTTIDLRAVVHLVAPLGGAAGSGPAPPPIVAERAALVQAVRVGARANVPLPGWWDAAVARQSATIARDRVVAVLSWFSGR